MGPRAVIAAALLCGVLGGSTSAVGADPLTLRDAYGLALKRSETIAIEEEQVRETTGRFLQALSGALPRVSFVSTDQRQDLPSGGETATLLRTVPNRRFEFSQPLFSGFREFAAMAGSRAERRQQRHELARAQQLLLVDVADAFYLVLESREDLRTLEAIRVSLGQRLEELGDRVNLGRARPNELISAESQLRRVEGEIEEARSAEQVATQLLEYLTGAPAMELVDEEPFVSDVGPADAYLARLNVRPDVLAAEEAARVAKDTVWVARSDFWPDVSLEGNYYTERVGASKDIEWDVLLRVDVPIFQGGEALGAAKERGSEARQASLNAQRVRRAAELDIRDAYVRLDAAIRRWHALDEALQLAEEDYHLQTEDYRLNLVSNLDVLRTLESLQRARQDAVDAFYDVKRQFWVLRAASGASL